MKKKGEFGLSELLALLIGVCILITMYYVIFYFNDIKVALATFFANFSFF